MIICKTIDDYIVKLNEYYIEEIKLENEVQYKELISILKLNLSNEINGIYSYALGYFYENGIGTTKDIKKSIIFFDISAQKGNSDAQAIMGYYYDIGYGVKKNNDKAIEWYLKASKNENIFAQSNLGRLYLKIGGEENNIEAIKWLMKAAVRGDANAQYSLSICYREGIGVKKIIITIFIG